MKYDEVCGTHNSYERGQETYKEFKYKGRAYLRDVGIYGRIILKKKKKQECKLLNLSRR
jgi:hypothetical protein